MGNYEKTGYLNSEFRLFHLADTSTKTYDFHYHDFKKIIIFLSGDVTYCIEGKSYILRPYDIVLVNAGEIHRPVINSNSIYERIIIYISPNFIDAYNTENYDLSYCFKKARTEQSNVLHIDEAANSRLYTITNELEASFHFDDYANDLYHNVLFLEFMIQLNRAAINNKLLFNNTDISNSKIISILRYINDHLTEDIGVDDIVSRFYLSRYYLMHLFKNETGYTLGEYISDKRLQYANELIKKGTPVTEACYQCGFKNYSTFSRAYKKHYGFSASRHNISEPDSNE